jgi:hypothetical protein
MEVDKVSAKPMREKLPQRNCIQCDKLFTPYRPKTKFCGNSCRVQNFWKRKTERSEQNELALITRINDLEAQLLELSKSEKQKPSTPKVTKKNNMAKITKIC